MASKRTPAFGLKKVQLTEPSGCAPSYSKRAWRTCASAQSRVRPASQLAFRKLLSSFLEPVFW